MVVAGIDGSTKNTGVAIFDNEELVFYTLVSVAKEKEKDTTKRVQSMLLKICDILDQYQINELHMEKAFKAQNVKTTMMLANLAGGIMLYCAKHDIQFVHPEPTVWRSKIGMEQGRGVKRETLKAEAIKAVKDTYNIDVNDDVAESILLARSAFDLPKINVTEDDIWGE